MTRVKEFIRNYGIEWLILHFVWAVALIVWFYFLYRNS
jgi:hypothetical protein